jgi:hypothetical protein
VIRTEPEGRAEARFRVPEPDLVRPPVPASVALIVELELPETVTPDEAVSVPFPIDPEVRVAEPTLWLKLPRFKAPPATFSDPFVDPRAKAFKATSVPLFTVVPPVKLFDPESVVVPAPFWVNPPLPAKDDAIRAEAVLVAVKEVCVSKPLPVIVPLPRVTAPTLWEMEVRFNAPAFTATDPPARAKVLEATRVPPFTVTPPAKLLLPLRSVVPDDWVTPADPPRLAEMVSP